MIRKHLKFVFLLLFLFVKSNFIMAQLGGGTYTIKSGGNYTSLTAAIAAINTQGLTAASDGDVIFLIGENQSVTESGGYGWKLNTITNASATNQVIFRPELSVDPVLTINLSAVNKTGWGISGVNYVTIDGWDQLGTKNKDMTIRISGYDGSTIELIDANPGCNNISIKNLNIMGNSIASATVNACILVRGSYHNNLLIENNYFTKSAEGIDCIGSIGGANNRNLTIQNNLFGSPFADVNRLSNFSINVGQYHYVNILNNEIRNMSAATSGNQVVGINLSIIDSLICSNNYIHDIANTGDAVGINQTTFMTAFSLKNYLISNNTIERLSASLSGKYVYGIYSATNQVKGSLYKNFLRDIYVQDVASSAIGMYFTGLQNANVFANSISRIYNSNTTNGAKGGRGIYFIGTVNSDTIANNFIFAIGGGSSTSWSESNFNDVYPYGIFVNTDDITNLKIYFNSLYLSPSAKSDANQTSYGVNASSSYAGAFGINTDSGRDIDMRNNIFYNVLSGDTLNGVSYQFPVMVYDNYNPFSSCNYNIYKMGRWSFAGLCNFYDWVALVNNGGKSLPEWRTFTSDDAQSITHNAIINCATGYATNTTFYTGIGDLHLIPGASVAGIDVGINSDFDGDVRTNPFVIGGDQGAGFLPIELLFFKAKSNLEKKVDVDWSTVSEINNDYFVVERSKNAADFEYLTKVDGAGNSNSTLYYQIFDKNPYEGISYYRLKQVDFDGSSSFSNICPVLIEGLEIIAIYPQPAIDNVTFKVVSSDDVSVDILIVDDIGRMIQSTSAMLTKGENIITIPVSMFANGVYLFNVSTSDRKFKTSKSFIIGRD